MDFGKKVRIYNENNVYPLISKNVLASVDIIYNQSLGLN